MKSYIYINQAQFYAYHGVMEQERAVGNTFMVSLSIEMDVTDAIQTDALGDTVSYADLYELVKIEMKTPSKLLEHVAGRIVKAVRTTFPATKRIEISITKKNPPIKGEMEGAGIRLISE
jgi:dihydroneopterin aldolase